MIDLEGLYFDWLLTKLHPDGVSEELARVCELLHQFSFQRRVGHDGNRAADGARLRKEFMLKYEDANINVNVSNDFMMHECSWLEMLIALSDRLDYLYDGGVENRFIELIGNLGMRSMLSYGHKLTDEDVDYVEVVTANVDRNRFDANGYGGLFPLSKDDHPDQRKVEIWEQQGAYFLEKLEGVLWTSTR